MAIIAKGNILHNGKNYKKGDEINDLKEDEAQRLLDLEVVEDDGSKAKSPKADKE